MIARDAAVPVSTVKEYYQILEDILIVFLYHLGPNQLKEKP
jgi:phosphate starvation-inducible membrane PsiE